jgi:hypothetical protein
VYTGYEFESFALDVRGVIDKYALFLEPRTLEMLEGIGSSALVKAFIQFGKNEPPSLDRTLNIPRTSYNYLYDESFIRAVRQHTDLLGSFLQFFNSTATEAINLAEMGLWRGDVAPLFGSGRTDTPAQGPNPPVKMVKRLPPTHQSG